MLENGSKNQTYSDKALNHAQCNQCVYVPVGGNRDNEAHCANREIGYTKHELCAIAFRQDAARYLCRPVEPIVCTEHPIRLDLVPIVAVRRIIELKIEKMKAVYFFSGSQGSPATYTKEIEYVLFHCVRNGSC